jgi:hypothetical protein
MGKLNKVIIKFLFILISLSCIDSGRSLFVAGLNIKFLLNHSHANDIEAPDHHQLFNILDDEKWIETTKFDFSDSSSALSEFFYTSENPSQDFTDTIWQPPKSV